MYKESISILIMIYSKTVMSDLLGLVEEEVTTTRKPVDIKSLENRYWCKFQPNQYDCGNRGRRNYDLYYFDILLGDCKPLAYSGDCDFNMNSFKSLSVCKSSCRGAGEERILNNLTENAFCLLQYDFGDCQEYHPMWYYDVSKRMCSGFSYSGCGGNQNRFETIQDCTTACIPNVNYKTWHM